MALGKLLWRAVIRRNISGLKEFICDENKKENESNTLLESLMKPVYFWYKLGFLYLF